MNKPISKEWVDVWVYWCDEIVRGIIHKEFFHQLAEHDLYCPFFYKDSNGEIAYHSFRCSEFNFGVPDKDTIKDFKERLEKDRYSDAKYDIKYWEKSIKSAKKVIEKYEKNHPKGKKNAGTKRKTVKCDETTGKHVGVPGKQKSSKSSGKRSVPVNNKKNKTQSVKTSRG